MGATGWPIQGGPASRPLSWDELQQSPDTQEWIEQEGGRVCGCKYSSTLTSFPL